MDYTPWNRTPSGATPTPPDTSTATPRTLHPDTLVRIGMWVEIDDEPGEFEWIPGGTACAQCGEPVQTGWREAAL